MTQTSKLLETLKRYLKAKGLTYRDLATDLGLSEASVKRLFSEHSFSLKRLEEVCKLLDLDFYDLARMSKMHDDPAATLTNEQEQELAKSPKLLTFLYLLISGWSPELIVSEYDITSLELSQILLNLDQLGVIELHPNNKVRVLVSKNMFWRKDGPIWELYKKRIQNEYLNHPFNLSNERLVFVPGKLSEASTKTILKQIDKLVKQFMELAAMDASIPTEDRISTGLVVAFRPWVLSFLSELKRHKEKN
ncbi:helix-turn-helix transcriptional regulator [Deltaproteobacteria bacterium TL4]